MMPPGAVSTAIRADVLSTYPAKTIANSNSVGGVVKWLTGGTYIVNKCDKHEVTILAAEDDFASMLLGELELYIDHCFEQLQEIGCFCSDTRIRSDAWNVVAIYYFGFFAAQTFLRLIGRPTYFLDKKIIDNLQAGAGATVGPGADAFYVERVAPSGVNQAVYRFRKSKEKIHESCWKTIFTYITDRYTNAKLPQQSAEALFYSSLQPKGLTKHYHIFDWPPLIRSRANYEAGFAYSLVANDIVAKTRNSFVRWNGITSANVHTRMRNSAQACDTSSKEDFAVHVAFLFDMSFVLFRMTREMYKDLLIRRRLDRRWELRRTQFLKKMATAPNSEFTQAIS